VPWEAHDALSPGHSISGERGAARAECRYRSNASRTGLANSLPVEAMSTSYPRVPLAAGVRKARSHGGFAAQNYGVISVPACEAATMICGIVRSP
jgi:hypothetical protein